MLRTALAAGDKEVELARLKAVMAPVEERILKLIDDAAPATRIFGRNLSKAYEKEFGKPLDPEQLTGQTDLRQMLGRRSLLPRTGVKGGGDQWYVYRLLQNDAAALDKVQDRIIQLISEVPPRSEPSPDSPSTAAPARLAQRLVGPHTRTRVARRLTPRIASHLASTSPYAAGEESRPDRRARAADAVRRQVQAEARVQRLRRQGTARAARQVRPAQAQDEERQDVRPPAKRAGAEGGRPEGRGGELRAGGEARRGGEARARRRRRRGRRCQEEGRHPEGEKK